jgi:hypothetical protein
MIASAPPTELARLLEDAAGQVRGILTASYPTPANRSYLHPVLGVLASGPRVAKALGEQIDVLFERPLESPAELLTLASLASALGWFTESLSALIGDVDALCTRAGLPVAELNGDAAPPTASPPGLGTVELTPVRAASTLCDLSPTHYADALAAALRTGARMDAECTEIADGLLEDAAQVADSSGLPAGEGTDSLPRLVRTLLSRTGAGR